MRILVVDDRAFREPLRRSTGLNDYVAGLGRSGSDGDEVDRRPRGARSDVPTLKLMEQDSDFERVAGVDVTVGNYLLGAHPQPPSRG
ncbi:hypothetical protein [Nocardia sp. NPDC051463]|uniref:hypothetical protein n=1 Tax=Nocardia sp. NPDC051463 TaxID=3154845 RepID=UPI00344BAE00